LAAGGGTVFGCTLFGSAKLGESKDASGISGCGGTVVVVVAFLVVGLGLGVVVVVVVVVVVDGGLMATGLWKEFSGTSALLFTFFLLFFPGWQRKLWKGWEQRSSSFTFLGTGFANAGTKTELSGTGCNLGAAGVVGANVDFIVLGGTDFFVTVMNVGSRNEFSPSKGGEGLAFCGASLAGIDADASG
jgi:hypothetical protein